MTDPEPPVADQPPGHIHPLPVLCWMWPVGGMFLIMIGGMILHFCVDPPSMAVEQFPRDHPRWRELMIIGGIGMAIGVAYGLFWYRFAMKRSLTRITWYTGTGLILTGVAFLLMTEWLITAVVFLAGLVLWAQRTTRKHFDWS